MTGKSYTPKELAQELIKEDLDTFVSACDSGVNNMTVWIMNTLKDAADTNEINEKEYDEMVRHVKVQAHKFEKNCSCKIK